MAGVGDYTESSSNTIGAKTNWINLANYFKIEHGVNNQGIGLLKKTYEMFDGNSSGAFASEGHSIDRWLDGVKKAKQYIEKNYKESGGNYFRKDADGNLGDAVSGVYGNPSGPTINDLQSKEVTEQDYEAMRNRYGMFNAMMTNGMQSLKRLIHSLMMTGKDTLVTMTFKERSEMETCHKDWLGKSSIVSQY